MQTLKPSSSILLNRAFDFSDEGRYMPFPVIKAA